VYDAAKTLLKNTNLNIEIQGYTDNIGAKSYNKTLSQKRADIVKNYLISKGVSADRLKSVGYGESNPIADNKSAQGRSMNRRIEFKILSESGSVQEPTSDYIKSTENPSKKSIQAEPQVIQENFTEKVNENEQNNIKTENPEKVENQEKIPEQVKEEPAPNINPPEEVKPQKQAYHPKTVVSKPANNEKESTTKYFMENLVGIYYPDPAYSLDIVGYSFFTIHGITSDDPTDAPIFRGMYKGIGLGFITFDGNTGINLFAHARLKSNFVFDFGYTFSSSELKGIYYSLGFSFPIQLDKNKSIIIDFGVAEIGSPTPFGRIGLLL
jgi:hypothetical protein